MYTSGLRDRVARNRILVRIDRLSLGNPGDVKSVGSGVSKLRIDCGPRYRVYYRQRGKTVLVLLCGGNKKTQKSDIRHAIEMAQEIGNDH